MTVELLILRHGKSDWDVDVDDFHRPLKDRGKRGAQRMGVWLLQQNLVPDHVLSSPAERALVTAEKLCKAMGQGAQGIVTDERVYAADVPDLLQALGDCPAQAQRVMLVGHNPGLEMLLTFLVDGPLPLPEDGKLLPTATLARLTVDAGWDNLRSGCAKLVSITRPGELPEKFPFPGPGSEDLRVAIFVKVLAADVSIHVAGHLRDDDVVYERGHVDVSPVAAGWISRGGAAQRIVEGLHVLGEVRELGCVDRIWIGDR